MAAILKFPTKKRANRRLSGIHRVFKVPLKSVPPHIVCDGRVAAKTSAAEGGDLCPRHSIPSVSIGSAARSRLILAGLWPLPPEVAVFDIFPVTGGSAGPRWRTARGPGPPSVP